jgi:hypothetical protein
MAQLLHIESLNDTSTVVHWGCYQFTHTASKIKQTHELEYQPEAAS